MKKTISGFTYIRNGFTYGYPFIEAIRSALPLVNEMIVVVGDSVDGSREAVMNLHDDKIKIVDSVWDEENRTNGKIFAMQSNIGIEHCSGDWALHIQADEVLPDNAKETLFHNIELADSRPEVDGLLFPFYHFWGDYQHIRNSRRVHDFEIRAFKNTGHVFSYRDSQGFRLYPSYQHYLDGYKGDKLKVIDTGIHVFHYSYCRNPRLMQTKTNYFNRFWHNDSWIKEHEKETAFDFNEVDRLAVYAGAHPSYMQTIIKKQDWQFNYNPALSDETFKEKILASLEKITGRKLFRYKNYSLVSSL